MDHGWTWVTALCVMIFSLMHFPRGTTCFTIKKLEAGNGLLWLLFYPPPTAWFSASCDFLPRQNLRVGITVGINPALCPSGAVSAHGRCPIAKIFFSHKEAREIRAPLFPFISISPKDFLYFHRVPLPWFLHHLAHQALERGVFLFGNRDPFRLLKKTSSANLEAIQGSLTCSRPFSATRTGSWVVFHSGKAPGGRCRSYPFRPDQIRQPAPKVLAA